MYHIKMTELMYNYKKEFRIGISFRKSALLLQIYLHEEGSEYWLQFFLFPSDVTITEIDTVGKIAYTIVKLKYVVDEKINTVGIDL